MQGLTETAAGNWEQRLKHIVDTTREMSQQTDPQAMVRAYASRVRKLIPADRTVALSRRGLTWPEVRITRSSQWKTEVNPWKEKDKLPVLRGGLLAELIYGDEPRIIDELDIDEFDPAKEFLAGQQSLIAMPNYDQGMALNMTVLMRKEKAAFQREELPEMVWMSNLFGRATHNLVLAEELQQAYEAVDREMRLVAEIQRSLLPAALPQIPTMNLDAHYQTSSRAGGDYYDFFPLPNGQWGILIADVSGHGTPAAVIMAIMHSIAHTLPGPPTAPGRMLNLVNQRLTTRYTGPLGTFVTAFYGIYDPATRAILYSSAGHNPPRLKRCRDGSLTALDGVQKLPLGIMEEEDYIERSFQLQPGDQIVFYTDGITEADNASGEMFGIPRLDRVLAECANDATDLMQSVLRTLDSFTEGRPASDDRTLVVAKIS